MKHCLHGVLLSTIYSNKRSEIEWLKTTKIRLTFLEARAQNHSASRISLQREEILVRWEEHVEKALLHGCITPIHCLHLHVMFSASLYLFS